MHFRWWNVIPVVAVLAASVFLAEPSKASARDKVNWRKTVNFSSVRHEQKPRSISRRKLTTGRSVSGNAQSGKSSAMPPVKVLATFEYGESALLVSPVNQPGSALKPAPARCEWARSIVQGYVFENVEAKSCEGSIYDFEAMREAKRFSIRINAINGELIKVEKIQSVNDARAQAENGNTLAAEPVAQRR